MKFYDTHAHFEKCDNVVEIVGRAAQAGVSEILAIGGSDELNCNALGTGLRTAIGLDRDQAQGNVDLNALCELIAASKPCVAAIGEIGLDCHYAAETLNLQMELFEAQLELAARLELPVVVHTREADEATLAAIDNVSWPHGDRLRGVIHSFTGESRFAGQLLDRGFAISFSGIATFPSAGRVRDAARYVPIDRILVETDSPFLAPVPMRGRRCEPAMVVHTARRLAEERAMPLELFAECAYLNSVSLFGAVNEARV
jgi:TatD DNase family protein